MIARFEIAGRPRPKGSMACQGGRQHRMVESVAGSRPWKLHMIRGIRERAGIVPIKIGQRVTGFNPAPYAGPVWVTAVFGFEGGPDGYPIVSNDHGDLDKLCRNLGDALEQSGLLLNDSQIVGWIASKVWATSGVSVEVRSL